MSSPLRPGASLEDELDYYKRQYEQLEIDLADFQASSKELEEQLERDIDAAEKKERKLREQVEKVNFEVEEWKTKHKQARADANAAQTALQKEITTMREANRTMQLKLRDTEVMNDDYERQARNTESSLEDLEARYNVAIERGVMLEEEMKVGEKEREELRIGVQRLRDELGELKVENDITREKLRLADETIETLRSRKPGPLAVESLRAKSPGSEASGMTPCSPTASTPPPRSDTASEMATPPSPPLSDSPTHAKTEFKTPVPRPRRSMILTEKPVARTAPLTGQRTTKHTRGPSLTSSQGVSGPETKPIKSTFRPRQLFPPAEPVPRSDSLHQIKALRGRMQKIEERVQSARSKLPAPNRTTPRNSPRQGTTNVPASVTLRRTSRRPISIASSSIQESETDSQQESLPDRRQSYVKRLSFGLPRPTTSSHTERERPPSALDRPSSSALERPPSASMMRPPSRTSMSSSINRPASRTGTRALTSSQYGHPTQSTVIPRSRSSIGGDYAQLHSTPRTHRPSASVSELRKLAAEGDSPQRTSPSYRRDTFNRSVTSYTSSIPSVLPRRQSGGLTHTPSRTLTRRESALNVTKEHTANGHGIMRPPSSTTTVKKRPTDVGETY